MGSDLILQLQIQEQGQRSSEKVTAICTFSLLIFLRTSAIYCYCSSSKQILELFSEQKSICRKTDILRNCMLERIHGQRSFTSYCFDTSPSTCTLFFASFCSTFFLFFFHFTILAQIRNFHI